MFSHEGDEILSIRKKKSIYNGFIMRLTRSGYIANPTNLRITREKLLSIINLGGEEITQYVDPPYKTKDSIAHQKMNMFYFTIDLNENFVIAYMVFNRIEKYSASGELVFAADRPLNFPETGEYKKN